jgi:hypothetical protein
MDVHKYVCHQLVRELSALLFLTTDEFFENLQAQENLENADSKEKESSEDIK